MSRLLTVILFSTALLTATGLQARDYHRDHHFAERPAGHRIAERGQRAERSLSEAIAIAKSRVPGELVSATRSTDRSGEPVYQIRILTRKGVVRTVRVPARAH